MTLNDLEQPKRMQSPVTKSNLLRCNVRLVLVLLIYLFLCRSVFSWTPQLESLANVIMCCLSACPRVCYKNYESTMSIWRMIIQLSVYLQGTMRDKGVILLFTSRSQTLTSERQSMLSAIGKRNRLAQFRVHKIASGIRMFESVLFPQQFIRIDDGACDMMVLQLDTVNDRFWFVPT